MQLSRIDFIRNIPMENRARVTFRGHAGHQYQQMLDNKGADYYLVKRIEDWYVVYEFIVAVGQESPTLESLVIAETWTVEEILAREG